MPSFVFIPKALNSLLAGIRIQSSQNPLEKTPRVIMGLSDAPSSYPHLVLMPSGRQGKVMSGITLLEAAQQLGVEIEAICGGKQTCGKCQIVPVTGMFPTHGITSAAHHLSPVEGKEAACAAHFHIDLSERRLACAARIAGDVLVTVPEESLARKQVVRKSLRQPSLDIAPALRLVYVEVSAPYDRTSDWKRLQNALIEQANLPETQIDIRLLRALPATLRAHNGALTLTVWQDREIIRLEAGYVEGLYGVAVDVGSTTLAAHLCDLRTGNILATATVVNPQIRYGEDLISRIAYTVIESQGLDRLHHTILAALSHLVTQVSEMADIDPKEIGEMVLVGNTVMHHLLLGIPITELGHLPFALAVDHALDLSAGHFGIKALSPTARIHTLPCIAGYVGADAVAMLLAEDETLDEKTTLMVDIGTNAEILLGNYHHVLCASSPTGPAFEGAQITHGQRAAAGAIERIRISGTQVRYKVIGDERWSDAMNVGESLRPTGICGSGIIEGVVELLQAGLLNLNGRFVDPALSPHPRLRQSSSGIEFVLVSEDESATGSDITITAHDVRAIQLAKGGLLATIRLLMKQLGINHLDRIRLAGAFGSHIDPQYAIRLGLIPPAGEVASIGNAAGEGAYIALLNMEKRRRAQTLARQATYVETATLADFQDYFVEALSFPLL